MAQHLYSVKEKIPPSVGSTCETTESWIKKKKWLGEVVKLIKDFSRAAFCLLNEIELCVFLSVIIWPGSAMFSTQTFLSRKP